MVADEKHMHSLEFKKMICLSDTHMYTNRWEYSEQLSERKIICKVLCIHSE